jgi:hypothetical protein
LTVLPVHSSTCRTPIDWCGQTVEERHRTSFPQNERRGVLASRHVPVAFLHCANEDFQRILGAGQLRFFARAKQPRGTRRRLRPERRRDLAKPCRFTCLQTGYVSAQLRLRLRTGSCTVHRALFS